MREQLVLLSLEMPRGGVNRTEQTDSCDDKYIGEMSKVHEWPGSFVLVLVIVLVIETDGVDYDDEHEHEHEHERVRSAPLHA